MSANIEALVKKISEITGCHNPISASLIRNALTEQAEAFNGELQAYDGTVRELTKTVEDMRAAQSVPVVGDAVAWGVTKRYEDAVWFISDSRFTAQHYANQYAHRIGSEPDQVVVPLYAAPTTSVPTAELEALRKDAERYRWLRDDAFENSDDCFMEAGRLFAEKNGVAFDAAIDAAIAQSKGE